MKLALISLSKDDDESGFPIGLLPLFDSSVLDAQVRAALQAGTQKIILLSPTMPGPLLGFVDQLKHDNIDAEVVRSALDLGQYAAATDEILYISDGILWDEYIAKALAKNSEERIYVTANNEDAAGFELIDLNHRWLGIAKLKASRLAEIQDIPSDWDTGSALLRTAVQAQCRREEISSEHIQSGSVRALKDAATLANYSKDRLTDPALSSGNFLHRAIIWPLSRRLLPRLWKLQDTTNYLGIFAIFTATLACILAYFSWPITAVVLMIFSVLSQKLSSYTKIFSDYHAPVWMKFVKYINMLALLVIFFDQSTLGATLPNLIICLVLFALQALLDNEPENKRSELFRPDILLLLLILLASAAMGSIAMGLYAVILFLAAYLLYLRFPVLQKR